MRGINTNMFREEWRMANGTSPEEIAAAEEMDPWLNRFLEIYDQQSRIPWFGKKMTRVRLANLANQVRHANENPFDNKRLSDGATAFLLAWITGALIFS